MATSNNEHPLKLIIKSANQKYEDFIVDSFELSWTVKQLKHTIQESYPKNPEAESIRLIYSGKLLNDHLTLNEVLRHNSDTKSHIIHLVHSNNNSNKTHSTSMNNINRSTNNSRSLNEDNEMDLDNELTPNSSTISSSSSTSGSSTSSPIHLNRDDSINRQSNNSFSASLQNNLNHIFQFQQQNREHSSLTPKEQFKKVHEYFIRYYESLGVPVQTNFWNSSYVQQMSLYVYMNSNYLNSLNSVVNSNMPLLDGNQIINESSTQHQEQVEAPGDIPAQPVPQPQAAQNRAARGAANNDGAERDDDWLSLLHNVVSFVVLFSIIYYYSSVERFLVIFSIVFILILYHNGWLTLQRRQIYNAIRRDVDQPDRRPEEENIDGNNLNRETPTDNQANPSLFRLISTFVLTFFTSLIPERPRAA